MNKFFAGSREPLTGTRRRFVNFVSERTDPGLYRITDRKPIIPCTQVQFEQVRLHDAPLIQHDEIQLYADGSSGMKIRALTLIHEVGYGPEVDGFSMMPAASESLTDVDEMFVGTILNWLNVLERIGAVTPLKE